MPKLRSDGRFALVQLAADRAPIYPAEDHQKSCRPDLLRSQVLPAITIR
jgi:hypothetical protein